MAETIFSLKNADDYGGSSFRTRFAPNNFSGAVWAGKCSQYGYVNVLDFCTLYALLFAVHSERTNFLQSKKFQLNSLLRRVYRNSPTWNSYVLQEKRFFFAVFSVRESVGSGFATMRAPNASQCEPKKDRFEKHRLARGKRSKSTQC